MLKVPKILMLCLLAQYCVEDKLADRSGKPSSDSEGDLPGYIAGDAEVNIKRIDGGIVSSGNTRIIMPPDAVAEDYTVKLKQLIQEPQLSAEKLAALDAPAGDIVVVEIVGQQGRLASSDLLKQYTFEQTFVTDDPEATHGFIVLTDPGTAREKQVLIPQAEIKMDVSAFGLVTATHMITASTGSKLTHALIWMVKYDPEQVNALNVVKADELISFGDENTKVAGSEKPQESATAYPGVSTLVAMPGYQTTVDIPASFTLTATASLTAFTEIEKFGVDTNAILNEPARFTLTNASGEIIDRNTLDTPMQASLIANSAFANAENINIVLLIDAGKVSESRRLVRHADLIITTTIDGRKKVSFPLLESDVAFAMVDNTQVDLSGILPYPPNNPKNTIVAANSATSIKLTWQPAGGSAAAYKIKWQAGTTAPADCAVASIDVAGGDSTSAIISGLAADSAYSVRICSASGDSPPQLSAGVTGTASTLVDPGDNAVPALAMVEPNGSADVISYGASYLLTWSDSDADNNATIGLFFKASKSGACSSGTKISDTLKEDADGASGAFLWDTAGVSPGAYYICATIDDGVHLAQESWSAGAVTIGNQANEIKLTNNDGVDSDAYEVAFNADGFAVVYLDAADGDNNVVFKRFDSGGNGLSTLRLTVDDDLNAHQPKIYWNGSEFGIAYVDERSAGTGREYYFHRVSASGADLGRTSLRSDDTGDATACCVNLAWSGNKWAYSGYNGDDGEVMVFDPDGTNLLEPSNFSSGGPMKDIDVAWNGKYFFLSEHYHANSGGSGYIYDIVVDELGNIVSIGTGSIVSIPSDNMVGLKSMYVGDAGFFIWQDQSTGKKDIFFRKVVALDGGNLIGNTSPIRLTPNGTEEALPRGLAFGGNNLAIAYTRGSVGSDINVFISFVSRGGSIGDEVQISPSDTGDADAASIVWTGLEYGIAYTDNRDGDNNVFFHRLAGDYTTISAERITPDDSDDARDPKVIWDGNQYILSYHDQRNGNDNFYINRIAGHGLGWPAKLKFTMVPQPLFTGECVQMEVMLNDADGFEVEAVNTIDFDLSETGSGAFYSDSDCSTAMTKTSIPENQSWRRFYFKTAATGTIAVTATASDTSIGSATESGLETKAYTGQLVTRTIASGTFSNYFDLAVYGNIDILWNGTDYAVVYANDDDGDNEDNLFFKRIDTSGFAIADGNGSSAPLQISPDGYDSAAGSRAAIVWNGSEYGIAYQDIRTGQDNIYFHRVAADGTSLGEVRVTSDTDPQAGTYMIPKLEWNGFEYSLAYVDTRDGEVDAFIRRYSSSGADLGEVRITPDDGNSTRVVASRWDGRGYGIVYWDANNYHIRRLSGGSLSAATVIDYSTDQGVSAYLNWTGSEYRAKIDTYGSNTSTYGYLIDSDLTQLHELVNMGSVIGDGGASTRRGWIHGDRGGHISFVDNHFDFVHNTFSNNATHHYSSVWTGTELASYSYMLANNRLYRHNEGGELFTGNYIELGSTGDPKSSNRGGALTWNGSQFGSVSVEHDTLHNSLLFVSAEGSGLGNPHHWKIAQGGSKFTAGKCYKIRIELEDSRKQKLVPAYGYRLDISTNASVFLDSACSIANPTPTISTGADYSDVYVKFAAAGSESISVDELPDLGLVADSINVTVE